MPLAIPMNVIRANSMAIVLHEHTPVADDDECQLDTDEPGGRR
jgi:hypothetical protein